MSRRRFAMSVANPGVLASALPPRKLLCASLAALLGGMAGSALSADPASTIQCDTDSCVSEGRTVIKLVARGETQSVDETPEGLQAQRRVEIVQEIPERVIAGTTSAPINLPLGGTVWAVEDPQLGNPELSASASSLVPFADGRIQKPVQFNIYSNYAAFAQRFELRFFLAGDTDLVTPVATLDVPVGNVSRVEWNGVLAAGTSVREGDELKYVLRAVAADGSIDETYANALQLVRPEDVTRSQNRLSANADSSQGGMSAAQIAERNLNTGNYGASNLRQQNIAIYGSRVRIRGEDIAGNQSVHINGQSIPVDQRRRFIAEYLVPVGKHSFEIEVTGAQTTRETLDVDVTGRYLFMVGLADVTLSKNSVDGAVVPVGLNDRYDRSISEGRLAFYLKGKVQGKYLVTAQADTHEQELRHLFDGFLEADARDVFRRLDPDRYYPVYGDDSTTSRDVDTQGRLYVRVDWDKNQALWGNFATGITGTEYGQYQRSLYGGALSWRSHGATELGEARHSLRVFGSQTQSAQGHTEFLGTGGSLYYLKHGDLLPGSDQIVLEVRDRLSGRTEVRTNLIRSVDYDIDELQGRLILTRPLLQIVRDNLPTITRDGPLDGFENRLLADYEYVPSGFAVDQLSSGFRGKTWLGEHVAIGGTYIDESRSGDDYQLAGADLTFQAGRGTYLKLEQTRTEATSAPVFYSDDGGLSFSQLNSLAPSRSGDARSVEARINFKELGWTSNQWTAGAWWREVDSGFSVSRFDIGLPVREQGAEFAGQVNEAVRLSGRYSDAVRGSDGVEQTQMLLEWRFNEYNKLSGELRQVQETRSGVAATGQLAALRYDHRFGAKLDVYATAQFTLDDDSGSYSDNDAFTVGAKYRFGEQSNVGAEASTGDRGDSLSLNAEYFLNPLHSLYMGYTVATDVTSNDPLFRTQSPSGLTLGQRWRVSSQINLYNESQFLKERGQSGIAHTFGMDFYPRDGWNYGFTVQKGELDATTGVVDRRAISLSAGHSSADTEWSSKLEYRDDSGSVDRRQWVSSNRLLHKFNDDWRLAVRMNYGDTQDSSSPLADAKFVEGNIGVSYRPAANDRLNLLGKVTYLYDLSSLGQDTLADFDQRSLIFSLEGIYRISPRWELGGKLAHREGEARATRNIGPWFSSTADFAAVQTRYDLARKWDGLLEYRWLRVSENDSGREGWLVGVDRHLGENFRVGVGYNFTSFSDNLTLLDYRYKGFFLNFTGTY